MSNPYLDIINKRKKDWNCEGLMDGAIAARGAKIPFSSPLLNWCTYGGIPRNKITEFFGEPSSGKSTTCIDVCKNAIEVFKQEYEDKILTLRKKASEGIKSAKMELADLEEFGPRKVLYIDLEHSFDEAWSKTLGINESEIDIMQPPDVTAEDILQTVQEIVETNQAGLIVLDSLPSLVPRAELDKKYGERTVASLAGLLTVFCRKIVPMLTRYETTMVFINQVRDNMDNPYVVKTPGGQAPKFYASLRILFKNGTPVDFMGNELPQSAENPAGYIINAKLMKQKSAPFDRKAGQYYLMINQGIRPDFDYAKLAIKEGIIRKSAGWFTISDPSTGEILEDSTGKLVKVNGFARVIEYLEQNADYYKKLQQHIYDYILCGKDPNEGSELLTQ